MKLSGKNFCISFTDYRDIGWCWKHGQSVMFDNGAFSFFTQGTKVNWDSYYKWVEPYLGHPHWAIVPDVIDGEVEENINLINQWPHRKDCAAVVWHLSEPLDHLIYLTQLGFDKICFGSSGKYWNVGDDAWCRRCDAAFDELSKHGPLPWVHMLRGLSLRGRRWPFASADSVNVARNYKSAKKNPKDMMDTIDSVQCPIFWDVNKLSAFNR
jgi:hypothetical protein